MSKFNDMLEWQLEEHSVMPMTTIETTIEKPYMTFLEARMMIINEPDYNGWLEHVKMSQATHDALCEQLNIKPILAMNGLVVIISESLEYNIYKFD